MDWLIENKEWLFSGLGVSILALIIKFVYGKRKNGQFQKSGKNSTNIQVGNDLNIGKEFENDKK